MHVIVDGYNVIMSLPSFKGNYSLQEARGELHKLLVSFKRNSGYKVTVVYDSRKGRGSWGQSTSTMIKGIKEVFTEQGEIADDRIVKMVGLVRENFAVITRDNDLEFRCTKLGAIVFSPIEFERKAQEAIMYDNPNFEESDKELKATKGTKKKGPSRRLTKSNRAKNKKKNKF